MTTRTIRAALLALFVQQGGPLTAEPLSTSWEDLRQGRTEECRVFLENYLAVPDCAQQVLTARLVPDMFVQCSPGHAPLDGQTIRIAGYAHPLEFEFEDVKSFLLIPNGRKDCRHPPPPLPDQIIAVEFPDGLDVNQDPVWVTGVLRLQTERNHLAPASYTLDATSISPATLPDVPEGG